MGKWRVDRSGPEWLMDSDGRVLGYKDRRGVEWHLPLSQRASGASETMVDPVGVGGGVGIDQSATATATGVALSITTTATQVLVTLTQSAGTVNFATVRVKRNGVPLGDVQYPGSGRYVLIPIGSGPLDFDVLALSGGTLGIRVQA